jgi:hypothetical protein
MQMIDVHLPTTDGRELVLTRCTEPEAELRLLLQKLKLELPVKPPPRITAAPRRPRCRCYGAGGEEWHHRRCNLMMEWPHASAER